MASSNCVSACVANSSLKTSLNSASTFGGKMGVSFGLGGGEVSFAVGTCLPNSPSDPEKSMIYNYPALSHRDIIYVRDYILSRSSSSSGSLATSSCAGGSLLEGGELPSSISLEAISLF